MIRADCSSASAALTMALRLRNLKTRTALSIASVIAAILVANGLYLILTKRIELRRDIESRALLFASLTTKPLCVGYDTYYSSGFYKFQELLRSLLLLEPDVEQVVVMSVDGRILFDSADHMKDGQQLAPGVPEVSGRRVEGGERLEAARGSEPRLIRGRTLAGADTLEVVAPYIEDWGRHRLSVAYHVSYRKLGPATRRLVYATVGLTLTSMLVAVLVAIALASRITRPLEELTAGAKGIAEGNFDRRLALKSGDELQILAETFNYMTERLKQNVEQLEESNRKLAAANDELKELDRVKSDLLANVSHELRTPLTAIKGYTDYLLDGKLGPVTEKQERGLVVVQRNLDRLSKSINALLDFSRMELGRITLNVQPFNLAQIVEALQTTLRSELEKKRIAFVADVPADLPPVVADRDKLSQVFENLAINALKFTPEGGRITVSAARVGGLDRPLVEVAVADTGIGIPDGQLGKIFNRFHQVDGSTTRRFGGVGLGLAIVKSILDAHGAGIVVESEIGRGTSFRFTLPLLTKGAEAPGREDRGTGAPEERTVLVIDDDLELLRLAKANLEDDGFTVLTATTGAEGTRVAARRLPDVILLDLMLPDRSGLTVLQTLKAEPATRHIPVLVVSICDDGIHALSLGAAEWLRKPVAREALTAALRRLLGSTRPGTPTALLLDDEEPSVALVSDILRAEGFEVLAATGAAQAIESIERARPDLVLLDLIRPQLSGFELLDALRRAPATAAVPVIVLGAAVDDGDTSRRVALPGLRRLGRATSLHDLVTEVHRQAERRNALG
jgi:signal transduction histidine kinase/DNA-binding response OmpR family regulator